MIVMGIDTETTGLDIQKDTIIECAYCIWDTSENMPCLMRNDLLHSELENFEISQDVTNVTNLKIEHLKKWGVTHDRFFHELSINTINYKPEFIVAHNGHFFDKPMLFNNIDKFINPPSNTINMIKNIPWIDTLHDLPFEEGREPKYKNLTYLAAYHEFINPFPHRALFDVMSTLKIFSKYPLDKILEKRADRIKKLREPRKLITATLDFWRKDEAKLRDFKWQIWDDITREKKWIKIVPTSQILHESFPFKVEWEDLPPLDPNAI